METQGKKIIIRVYNTAQKTGYCMNIRAENLLARGNIYDYSYYY